MKQTPEQKLQILKDNIKNIEDTLKWTKDNTKDLTHLKGYLRGLMVALEILTTNNAISPFDIPF